MPTTTTPEVVSIEEARDYLGYADDRDTYVETLVVAAREYCEKYSNRTFRELVVRSHFLSCWPTSRMVKMPHPPLIDINSVTYYDDAGASQTVTSTNYRTHIKDTEVGVLEFEESWSYPTLDVRANPITISYDSGYTSLANIPADIKMAILFVAQSMDLGPESKGNHLERAHALLAENEWGSFA